MTFGFDEWLKEHPGAAVRIDIVDLRLAFEAGRDAGIEEAMSSQRKVMTAAGLVLQEKLDRIADLERALANRIEAAAKLASEWQPSSDSYLEQREWDLIRMVKLHIGAAIKRDLSEKGPPDDL